MKASLPFKYIIADKKGKNYVVFDFKDDSGKRKRKRQNSARRSSVMMLNARQVLSSRHFLITGLKRSNRHSPEPLIRATLAISPGSKTILTSVIRIFCLAT